MAETLTEYPTLQPKTAPTGLGVMYNMLGYVFVAGLLVALVLGFNGIGGLGVFSGSTAFAVGALAILLTSGVLLILLFTLSGHIRQVQDNLAYLARVRSSIEENYARLEEATRSLAEEIQELRQVLPQAKKAVEPKPVTVTEAASKLQKELHNLRIALARAKKDPPTLART